MALAGGRPGPLSSSQWVGIASPLVLIGIITIRRLHDLDRSGWHIVRIGGLAALQALLPQGDPLQIGIAILGTAIQLTLVFWPGTRGSNRFGRQGRKSQANALLAQTGSPAGNSEDALLKEDGSRGIRGSSLVWSALSLFAIAAVAVLIYARGNSATCSDPEVKRTLQKLVTTDRLDVILLNESVRLDGIRTVRTSGSFTECAALLVSTTGGKDLPGNATDVRYRIQTTDANDGTFVVSVEN